MARYEALKHLRVGVSSPAPGAPLESEQGDGRNWPLMVRLGKVRPWPDDKPWPMGGEAIQKPQEAPTTEPTSDDSVVTVNATDEASTATGYDIVTKPRGWYAISLDGVEVTKSLREDAVDGFAGMSDDEKAAFVAANRPSD